MATSRKAASKIVGKFFYRNPVEVVCGVVVTAGDGVTEGNHPDIVEAIFNDVMDPAIDHTAWIVGFVSVNPHAVAIVFAKARPGAEPHKAIFIFGDAVDGILWQSVGRCDMIKPKVERLSVAVACQRYQHQNEYISGTHEHKLDYKGSQKLVRCKCRELNLY